MGPRWSGCFLLIPYDPLTFRGVTTVARLPCACPVRTRTPPMGACPVGVTLSSLFSSVLTLLRRSFWLGPPRPNRANGRGP